ncbi:hypothetical protein [Agrobacterium pusense]|uniref:hypothetical protein n=1 Tax=Agrobacterium pusense TaxID=648995 RepID=UPI000ECF277E|nr:hypothetical protein [Agrobacterium sp.]
MAQADKFIVVPFTEKKRHLAMAEMRQSSSAEAAKRLALSMSSRFPGVSAYAIKVDTDSGDLIESTLLTQIGRTMDIMAEV